jgi:predicted Ser/Thr protein kinase
MTLAAGTRLGPYEILSPLGAGGMGEVYRARDERLGRDVAIKVLPAEVASDSERLKRFEKEARSASALNHANIVTVYDIGTTDGTSWIAMERVEGETLRKVLAAGPLALKKLLAVGAQIAEGLSKAHATGIVHRDLKPENVMVTKEGVVKILDFGLAKLIEPTGESGELTHSPTVSAATSAGVVVGTVGYMSPEQALGEVLDFRSDQFAFGAILYEMAAGKRAFARRSAPETMTAIIREEPEPLATAAPETPIPLRWVVERCLAKDREERYAATKDLARDLARIREGLTEGSLSGTVVAAPVARRTSARGLILAAAALVAGAAVAVVATREPRHGPPLYRPVSFHRGSIGNARFAPDGKTILYSAAWDGKAPQLFSTRLDSTESATLPFPSADLLSISSGGKLAILVVHDNDQAAIAEVPMAGGAPRELVASDPPGGGALQFAQGLADWHPGDERLAVIRDNQLEYPIGKVLVPSSDTTGIMDLRFSPDGRSIALVENQGKDNYALGVADLSGKKTILSKDWEIITSLAWHPGTGEIWFSGRKRGVGIGVVELHAITLSGKERLVAQNPQLLIVEDIARDGSVLARSDDWPEIMMCQPPGATREINLTYFDFSESVALSADGRDLLFVEGGAASGATGGVYLRKTDGSGAAVRLGDGWIRRQDLSSDKQWVVQALPDRLILLPVGPGEQRTVQDKDFRYRNALWFPDGKRLLISATTPGHGPRLYVRDVTGGPPRPITPEGTVGAQLSRSGKTVAAQDSKSEKWALYPVDGGQARPLPDLQLHDWEGMGGFDEKDENLYIVSGRVAQRIDLFNLATGKRTFFREVAPADPTGVGSVSTLQLTPDGKSYCYSFMRGLSRLYVVSGLR